MISVTLLLFPGLGLALLGCKTVATSDILTCLEDREPEQEEYFHPRAEICLGNFCPPAHSHQLRYYEFTDRAASLCGPSVRGLIRLLIGFRRVAMGKEASTKRKELLKGGLN